MIHNAECHIKANINPQENVLYRDAALTKADLNRIFPDWEKKILHFAAARWPKQQIPADQVILQSIQIGMLFAVEEIMRSKI